MKRLPIYISKKESKNLDDPRQIPERIHLVYLKQCIIVYTQTKRLLKRRRSKKEKEI